MPVPLHAATDDVAFQHVENGEQRGGAVALVVMGHGAAASALERQAGLGAVERLDLTLFGDRQDNRMRRRIDIQADNVGSLAAKCGSLDSLNCRSRCGCSPWARQMRCTELTLMPTCAAIAPAVQCVVSPGRWPERQRHDRLGDIARPSEN
jgi:hypothetical protein